MDKIIIEYDIPIQDQKHVDEWNEKYSKWYDNHESFKTTEEYVDILIDKFLDAISMVGDDGGWFINDEIQVKIELEYVPEDK